MTAITLIDQFRTDAARFGEVVDAGGVWEGASPCEGWTAAHVVEHVIATQRDFLDQRGVDTGPAPDGTPAERWRAHRELLDRVLTPEFVESGFDGYFGPTTVADALRDFYMFDLLVHRWDLALAFGQPAEFSDAELDRLEAAVPEPGTPLHAAFYSAGVCQPAVDVDPGAARLTRVMAKFGRAA